MNYDTMAFGVGFVGMVILLILISILPFYFLWNWIMPLFGLPNLTMLQCWGLLLLVQIFRLPTNYMKDK